MAHQDRCQWLCRYLARQPEPSYALDRHCHRCPSLGILPRSYYCHRPRLLYVAMMFSCTVVCTTDELLCQSSCSVFLTWTTSAAGIDRESTSSTRTSSLHCNAYRSSTKLVSMASLVTSNSRTRPRLFRERRPRDASFTKGADQCQCLLGSRASALMEIFAHLTHVIAIYNRTKQCIALSNNRDLQSLSFV
jgi:hypothetical protein